MDTGEMAEVITATLAFFSQFGIEFDSRVLEAA